MRNVCCATCGEAGCVGRSLHDRAGCADTRRTLLAIIPAAPHVRWSRRNGMRPMLGRFRLRARYLRRQHPVLCGLSVGRTRAESVEIGAWAAEVSTSGTTPEAVPLFAWGRHGGTWPLVENRPCLEFLQRNGARSLVIHRLVVFAAVFGGVSLSPMQRSSMDRAVTQCTCGR